MDGGKANRNIYFMQIKNISENLGHIIVRASQSKLIKVPWLFQPTTKSEKIYTENQNIKKITEFSQNDKSVVSLESQLVKCYKF